MAEAPVFISQHDWNCQKDNFIDLYHRRKLPLQSKNGGPSVIQTMRDEHSFCASLSQYEAQIRRWDTPKNLKRSEWAHIIAKMDDLKSGGVEARLKLAGSLVGADKIKQKRRRYLRATATTPNVAESPSGSFLWNSSRFTLEILSPNGQWSPYRGEEASGHTPRHAILSSPITDTASRVMNIKPIPSNSSTVHYPGLRSINEQAIRTPVPTIPSDEAQPLVRPRASIANADSYCRTEHLDATLDPSQDTLAGVYEMNDSTCLPDYRFLDRFNFLEVERGFALSPSAQEFLLPIAHAVTSPSSPLVESFAWSSIEGDDDVSISKLLEDSPFFLLEKQFRGLSITSTSRSGRSYLVESCPSSTILPDKLTERHHRQSNTSVFREITSSASNAQMIAAFLGQERLIQNHRFKTFTDSLGSLLPDNLPGSSDYTGGFDESLLAAGGLLDSPFHRAILYSIINSCAGLPRRPASPPLQNYSSFFGLIKSGPYFAVRSFIDNAFSTAVWSLNAQAVDLLLKMTHGTPYPVDVHKVIVSKGQTPSRPIEVALRYARCLPKDRLRYSRGALETAEVLLKAGADPTQALLVFRLHPNCPDSKTLQFIGKLLDRGAKPDVYIINFVVNHGDETLTELLFARTSHASYKMYFYKEFSDSMPVLARMVPYIKNSTATQIIKSVFCDWMRSETDKHFPGTYESTINDTLIQACAKGNKELVEFLLPFVSRISSAALAAAIRSCQQPLIELLLESGANMSDVPVDRYEPGNPIFPCMCQGRDAVIKRLIGELSTPMAEAIRSRNLPLIEKLECTLTRAHTRGVEQALEAAADVGDLDLSRKILYRASNVIGGSVRRPLCLAIDRDQDDIAFMLLDAGMEVNLYFDDRHNHDEDMPLLSAIMARKEKLIEAILEHDPNMSDPCYIRAATLLGDLDTVKALLSSDATVSVRAMNTALKAGNENILSILSTHFWRHDPSFQHWNSAPDPPIHHDSQKERIAIVRSAVCTKNDTLLVSFLERGMLVSGRAIKTAMRGEACAMVERLLSHAMKPSITLDMAVRSRNHTVLRQWLSKGLGTLREGAFLHAMRFDKPAYAILMEAFKARYPQGLEGWGGNLLKNAIRKNDSSRLKDLLDARVDVHSFGQLNLKYNARGLRGDEPWSTPLGFAIYSKKGKNLGDVQLLLDAGSDPNGMASNADADGSEPDGVAINADADILGWKTPLILAIETGDLDLIQALLERRADVNLAARHGRKRTPLQRACEMCNLPVVKLLLSWHADVNGEPAIRAGGTALQLTAISGSIKIAELLLQNGADVRAPPAKIHGRTPFEGAAENGRLDMLKVIWDATFPEGIPEGEARRAIHLSRTNGHRACEQYITYLVPMADISRPSADQRGEQWQYLDVQYPSYSRPSSPESFRGILGDESGEETEESYSSDDEISCGQDESDWND